MGPKPGPDARRFLVNAAPCYRAGPFDNSSRESAGMPAAKVLKVRVDRERCQGHARCFALAPELFELDQFGNGRERGDGSVPVALEDKARLAQANCPELAVEIIEE
jgi:ferredoxin